MLFWAGIVRHRLSANQITRCFKYKKLKSYMKYQVDFFLPLKQQKISSYFGLWPQNTLGQSVCRIFCFDLFDLLILIPVVHCYTVLVAHVLELLAQKQQDSNPQLWTKWLWVQMLLLSLKFQILRLFWARSCLAFRQLECRFTLKRLLHMIITYSQLHYTNKYSQHSSIICPLWLNGWLFIYKLSGSWFESHCCHLSILHTLYFAVKNCLKKWNKFMLYIRIKPKSM